MAVPEDNEKCHYVQNDPNGVRLHLKKCHFNILWCYGVIKESFSGKRNPPLPPPPPGEVGFIHLPE